MKWYWAIPFTVAILIVTLLISGATGLNLAWLMVLGTAIWTAVDSKNIDLKKYKSGISYRPAVLFIAVSMLWIIGFPWYLHVRYTIKNGLAELKDVDEDAVPDK